MRAQAKELAPVLAHMFPGLLPWTYGRLTPDELRHFIAEARAYVNNRGPRG